MYKLFILSHYLSAAASKEIATIDIERKNLSKLAALLEGPSVLLHHETEVSAFSFMNKQESHEWLFAQLFVVSTGERQHNRKVLYVISLGKM